MKVNNTERASTTEATPTTKKKWFSKVKNTLRVITKAVILAPIKLPAKLKMGAQYLAILLGILDSIERSGSSFNLDRDSDTEKEDIDE